MSAPPPLTPTELDAFAARFNGIPMMRHHGLVMSFPGSELVVVTLPVVRPEHRGGLGSEAVNGGTLSAMFDFALGCTAMRVPPLRKNATVQLSITFQHAVRGSSVRCEARGERSTKSLLFSSARMLDERGDVCGQATAVISFGRELSLQEWTEGLEQPRVPS